MAKTINRDEVHKGYIDFDMNEARNLRLQQLGADIGSPVNGLFFYRSDSHKIRARINGAWQDMATMADVTAAGISANLIDAKGDLLVGTADNTVARKAVGGNGTFLQAQSAQADGLTWVALVDADIPASIMRDSEGVLQTLADAKGDIIAASGADTWAKVTVGANGTLLVANSAAGSGLNWRTLVAADIQELLATNDLTDWPRVAALPLNGQKITGLADGTASGDAVTFDQLNAIVNNQTWKDPVDAMTTAALPAVTATTTTLTANANGALAAQDGITLVAGESLLVKDQAAGAQNGIYLVTQVGTGGTPFILTRRVDADSAAELTDATVLVDAGTTGKGDIYTFPAITTLGTTDATPVKTGEGNTIYTADEVTLTLSGQQFAIKAGGVANAQVAAAAAIAYSKLALTNSIVNADIGAAAAIAYSKLNLGASIVNADVATAAAIAYSKLALTNSIVNADIAAAAAIAYSKLSLAGALLAADVNGTAVASGTGTVRITRTWAGPTVGGATSEVLTHNLGTRDVHVTVCNQSTPWDEQEFESERTSTSTITLRSPINIPASLRVVITG